MQFIRANVDLAAGDALAAIQIKRGANVKVVLGIDARRIGGEPDVA